ncbi:exodeoxyribonuclease V subunit beta [Thalassomonas viridans]|uniref:RecBCD enzyme subunit RecB n=1 Tax=Thalassomonas viridans TaxID=137584 RepID=A0AAE9Z6P1_9GAMM|nr:exodeoxyribonuclease V subunit beta [Thalassomonas viridans]WDE07751.1 exodeoxyribonuclease V subunit beta [Thalassomonas viridans]
MTFAANNLVAHEIPLTGKHLIEASAGTGKTFNITRLYLRLLLEQKLPVEQILVMTFTKDATEELRGRIGAFIRSAINDWHRLVDSDPYFAALAEKVTADEAGFLLKKALLFLDEAAIFTIHGFCKRVLSQHAFASGMAFNSQMEASDQELLLEACQDWYRVLAQQSPQQFELLAAFWGDPQTFLSHFSKAVRQVVLCGELETVSAANIRQGFLAKVQQALYALEHHDEMLSLALIEVKTGQEQQKRRQELSALKAWLAAMLEDIETFKEKMPDAFIDGRRFSRSKHKQQLVDIFTPVNEVKAAVKSLQQNLDKAQAYVVVKQGLDYISEQLAGKKQQQNMLSFDDLISRLKHCLTDDGNPQLAQVLFAQFPVALVDEFQDTDPLQFAILKAIYFQQPDTALFMIGDPKQAIYGFRGGDVFTYLSARNLCDYQWLMDTNWRSSPEMIRGYNRLFYGNHLEGKPVAVFGYGIPYVPVKASPAAAEKSLPGPGQHALEFVHFTASDENGEQQEKKKAPVRAKVKQDFRPVMAGWCAGEIARLLAGGEENTLAARDIAILVRDGSEAAAIKQALQELGLASVFLSNKANLLHSEQTEQFLCLLKGVLYVENERLYTAALACGLLGFTPAKLYRLQRDELGWQELKFRFLALRQEWQHKGFITMALKLMHEHFVIRGEEQDRALTNLLHLFEILQSASQRHRQPQELLYYLEQEILKDNPESETELRLESDANLIKIVTQHGSKGLEYPVVFIPFATRHKDPLRFGNRNIALVEYHDSSGRQKLSLDGSSEARQAMADEAYAESIRLLYVAVTRAEQRCYILTAEFEQYFNSPLGKTLKWQKEQDILASLHQLADEHPGVIGVKEICEPVAPEPRAGQSDTAMELTPAAFHGKIERDWWLSSFSALSRNLRHGGVSTPDRDGETGVSIPTSAELLDSTLLRFNLAKGAHTGNLLHDIFEHLDFSRPNWQESMKWPLVKYGELTPGYSEQDLTAWLKQVLMTPLLQSDGTEAAEGTVNWCLADIPVEQTLRESEFYFPMSRTRVAELARLLTRHRQLSHRCLSAPGQQHGQLSAAKNVSLPAYQQLKGMMHGFIDLVFEYQGKYYLSDYKSSHLGNGFHAYKPAALLANIQDNYYDLQYLIYALALHRHLAYALEDYDPGQHFGGIYYFYLRGMTDDAKHAGCGVYYRHIDLQELTALDAIFAGEHYQDKGQDKGQEKDQDHDKNEGEQEYAS